MARNLFRNNFVIFFNVAKMFAETVCKFPSCVSYVEFFAWCTGYAVDDVSGDACKSTRH